MIIGPLKNPTRTIMQLIPKSVEAGFGIIAPNMAVDGQTDS